MQFLSRTILSYQALVILVAGVFLFGAVFSVSLGRQIDEYGNMSECFFMAGQTSVCPMGVMEHIAEWRQSFIAVLSQLDALASAILFFLAVAMSVALTIGLNKIFSLCPLSPLIQQASAKAKLFDHLVMALSQGILNPLLYA